MDSNCKKSLAAVSLCLALLLVACGPEGLPPADPDDAAVVPEPDLAPMGCRFDGACGDATPICDERTGQCVACLTDHDSCPAGSRCLSPGGQNRCAAGCDVDEDCRRNDGGAPSLACCNSACVDTAADTAHCGGCATACGAIAHGKSACVAGKCGLDACDNGWADCDGDPRTGCEVDLTTDLLHCGDCHRACPVPAHATGTCAMGACSLSCNTSFADCNGDPADGCEIDLATDTGHCGACATVCAPVAHGAPGCQMGQCGVGSCNAGFDDCNKDTKDGCEADLGSDKLNCSSCGKACPAVANALPACTRGGCGIGACNGGYEDCDKMAGNGCEVSTATDVSSCGGCGMACSVIHVVRMCANGSCQAGVCAQGFADCDVDKRSNGCESELAIDRKNCGACGNNCAAGQLCEASACQACYAINLTSTASRVSLASAGWSRGVADFTLEFWVKLHDQFAGDRIIGMNEAYAAENVQTFLQGGRVLCNTYKDACPCGKGTGNLYALSGPIDDGKWHHVACVRTGGSGAVYTDGVLSDTDIVDTNLIATSNISIGKLSGYPNTAAAPMLLGPWRFSSVARYMGAFSPRHGWPVDGSTISQFLSGKAFDGVTLVDEAGGDNNSTSVTATISSPNDSPCF